MRKPGALVLVSSLAVLCSCSLPFVTQVPLKTVPSGVGTVYPPRPVGITVAVTDARADAVVLGGLTAPSQSDRVLRLFAEDRPGKVAEAFQTAAIEAASALGFRQGTDVRLEISIRKLYVDMYRASGLSAANCIGYGEIQSTLKSSEGSVLRTRDSRVVYWEDTNPVGSFDEISEEAISRICAQAAWETAVRILQEQYAADLGGTTLERALRVAQGKGEEMPRREAIFWLGLVGRSDPAAEKALVEIFRTSDEQNLAEGAAEAIGMIGLQSAREEIESMLSGARRVGKWETDDTESVWYLLKALHLLGASDLEARIPPRIKMRVKLTDLVAFLEHSAFPKLDPKQIQDIENGKRKLKTP